MSDEAPSSEWESWFTAGTLRRLRDAEKRIAELEAIIKTHDLCHDLHGKVGPREFADGCAVEQRKLFGCAPDADRIAELEAALRAKEGIMSELDEIAKLQYRISELEELYRAKELELAETEALVISHEGLIKTLHTQIDKAYGRVAILEAASKEHEQKWRLYEQEYILPVFRWADEEGIPLSRLVREQPGKNCVQLFYDTLRTRKV